MYLYLDSKHWAIWILSMVLLNCICSIKQPQNIWKDITMKEMTSSNQTSFSLNLKSFFKRPFGAAIDKINNRSFVHCLVQENVLLVILSNLTALYVWQCSWCVSSTSEGVSSVPHIQLHCKCFVCWNRRRMSANQVHRQLGVILTDLICNQIILFPCYFYRHLFVVLGVLW